MMSEIRRKWCVSIYMPIDHEDRSINRTRLKNLVTEAQNKLLSLGLSSERAAHILNPVEMIMENSAFWTESREGFAVFFTADSFVWTSMHYKMEEIVVVSDRFHLKPLLRTEGKDSRFYLLALSQKQIKFYEASRNGLSEVFLRGMPKSIENYLRTNSQTGNLQSHSAGKAQYFHGNGGNDNSKDSRLLELFRKVDGCVTNYISDDETPLVLAGVGYLHPIYREANSYSGLLDTGVKGNAEKLPLRELLEKALPVVRPAFRHKRETALTELRDKLDTRLASDKFPEVFEAATEGRVETLFVPVGKQEWGTLNADTGEPELHHLTNPGDKDLLCVISTRTLRKGGKVFVLRPEQMPNNSTAAAIFRY